ncbi:MAG: nickel pincer cofactor biosynthesis protein LarC, partial [Sarcina sp.]|nr:nickel pincer cofactor biosynthesis protein LarC [Sarcina sp.]
MKTLYLECNMGAAGDMLSAALLELYPDPAGMVDRLNALGIPGVSFEQESVEKCGIRGTHLKVTVCGEEEESLDVHSHTHEYHEHTDHTGHDHDHGHEHDHDHCHDHCHSHEHDHSDHHHEHTHGHSHSHVHRNLEDIRQIVNKLDLPEAVRGDVLKVYSLIAEAESHAHGRPVTEVHFHEVGSMDAVADITAFCLLLSLIGPEKVVVSPIKLGFGEVRCAHGILPVPAPATAWILRDVPVYAGNIRGEMCTPTGAAILKCFADEFGSLPQMQISKVGIGCGKKDFEQANIVRALLGEMEDSSKTTGTEKPEDRQAGSGDRSRETVLELSCNLDDMTPEAVGFAMEELLEAGALDVYTIPVTMKKNRPGFILNCLCRESMREKILSLMFLHTTTLGIREYLCNRYTLQRRVRTVTTDLGEVRCKTADG